MNTKAAQALAPHSDQKKIFFLMRNKKRRPKDVTQTLNQKQALVPKNEDVALRHQEVHGRGNIRLGSQPSCVETLSSPTPRAPMQ